jgi:glutamate dehydrogenase
METTQDILDLLAQSIGKKVPEKYKKASQAFVKGYFANVPMEDLKEESILTLEESVFNMWTFIQMREKNKAKIRIYTEKQETKLKTQPKTIVEILNDNMPFLVDSVTAAINSFGYPIHLLIHPVLQVKRDNKQVLESIIDTVSDHDKDSYESFIHCEIPQTLSPKKCQKLEEDILGVLENVRCAVEDWKSMRNRLSQIIKGIKDVPPHVSKGELEEILSFLSWIEDNHFTFLGFCEYKLVPGQKTLKESLQPVEGMGVLRNPKDQEINNIFEGVELTPSNIKYLNEPNSLIINKTSKLSVIHRRDTMDAISIKRFDKKGQMIGLYQFVGLFTSVAYSRSARDIPLLRRKISRILEKSGLSEHWHDGKALIHILESFPRDELFQADEDWLFKTSMKVVQIQNRQRLTLFIRTDKFERFVSCLVYIPRDRYDSDLRSKIASILEIEMDAKLMSWQTQLGELAFARVHYIFKLQHKGSWDYDVNAIEQVLIQASLTWKDQLKQALFDGFGEKKGLKLYDQYGNGFTKGYQEKFTPNEAIVDIDEIEHALAKSRIRTNLSLDGEGQETSLNFKLYSLDGPVSLSNVLPVLENMNLRVLSEIPFIVTLANNTKVWIHDFETETREGEPYELEHVKANFLEGFSRVWREEVENDGFNRLILKAKLDWRECQLIRAYAKYIRQLQTTFSQTYMEDVLAKYPQICNLMIKLFSVLFSPDSKEDREDARLEILSRIKHLLLRVDNLDEDRILNKFVNAINSTLRTNYYQKKDNKPKPYLSFKIDCTAIDEMPLPRPKYEIFVYSTRVEAIHLRGGKVARGGIRWSDRKEDFRTEVLGLMKAQMVKNAVIVPVGSKGGFIVKHLPLKADRAAIMDEVISCYKTMIQGLLDITDNIKGTEIVYPKHVVRRDEDDPYLVVAADKGTSTFSDFANQISAEYDFWLGDAFASGGSSGYDHKKMAITSRGAWESVKRHFREMNIDATSYELTVVGIGDMSGDVFGNGMLLSGHLKLLAAFNHLHIFIDPSPNPEQSFIERKRLFDLPQSSWADYNPSLISKGGGVFDRKAKSITPSPEIKELLDIKEDSLTPDAVIRSILKAQVDLMWLGGIGTYIKSKSETNAEVGDRVNDSLRINGNEVRASVIAEGANLGVTQLGRIEYAKKGGHINTDAIDNSGGVDCSDHEVNIKILLNQVMVKGELTLQKRNTLLEQMTDDVSKLVLKDNFWQNQIISILNYQGNRLLEEQARLMRDLEDEGLLNRALEGLPDEIEISRRIADRQGLTRPELAVLLAYSKISLNHQLIHSEIPDISILQPRLFSYFPEVLQKIYAEEIKYHPLRREITATLFTNSIVNRMGVTFIHEMKRLSGVEGADVARAYVVVRDLLDLITLWRELETMETLSVDFQTKLMIDIYQNVKRFTDWFLKYEINHDIESKLKYFKPSFEILRSELSSLFSKDQRTAYETRIEDYVDQGLTPSLANRLLGLEFLVSAPDIIILSKQSTIDVRLVAKVYFALGGQLGFEWIRKQTFNLSGETHWHQEAANALIEELYETQKELTHLILSKEKNIEKLFDLDGAISKTFLNASSATSVLADLKNAASLDFAMLTVMNRQLKMLIA